jgi:hypothetical protein
MLCMLLLSFEITLEIRKSTVLQVPKMRSDKGGNARERSLF